MLQNLNMGGADGEGDGMFLVLQQSVIVCMLVFFDVLIYNVINLLADNYDSDTEEEDEEAKPAEKVEEAPASSGEHDVKHD